MHNVFAHAIELPTITDTAIAAKASGHSNALAALARHMKKLERAKAQEVTA
jgi:hypothetical protein